MDIDDIDVQDRSVLLRGKGGKQRLVPVGRPAVAALDAYLVRGRPDLAGRSRGTAAVFLNARGGRLSRQSAWQVLQDAAVKSREFERKDTREEAAKALADIKGKGMQVNELSAAEANRMREKLVSVNAGIAKSVGQQTWDEVNAAVQQAREDALAGTGQQVVAEFVQNWLTHAQTPCL